MRTGAWCRMYSPTTSATGQQLRRLFGFKGKRFILVICLALYVRLFHPGAFAICADEVAREHVKTLRSREIGDRVIKAEEAVAHREKSHPNQMKLVA